LLLRREIFVPCSIPIFLLLWLGAEIGKLDRKRPAWISPEGKERLIEP
jgi:hypothetical protein